MRFRQARSADARKVCKVSKMVLWRPAWPAAVPRTASVAARNTLNMQQRCTAHTHTAAHTATLHCAQTDVVLQIFASQPTTSLSPISGPPAMSESPSLSPHCTWECGCRGSVLILALPNSNSQIRIILDLCVEDDCLSLHHRCCNSSRYYKNHRCVVHTLST